MKKRLIILFFVIMLVGCNDPDNEQSKKGTEENLTKEQEHPPLAMQLLKADEENGVTLDEELYQQLAGIVEENPMIGVADDFSVHAIDFVETVDGESVLLFLGINHLERSIKNITFDYTLGIQTKDSAEFIIEGQEVDLSDTFAGVIQPNHAIPFTIPVRPEGEALLQLMNEGNKIMKIENAEFEWEE